MLKQTMPIREGEDAVLQEATAIIRRSWQDVPSRLADSEKMIAASMFTLAAEDMDGIRAHLESLVNSRNVASNSIKQFKHRLEVCRHKIAEARCTQHWIVGAETSPAPLRIISEIVEIEEEDAIRRLLRSLDRKTYAFLAELKGSLCPLCGKVQ